MSRRGEKDLADEFFNKKDRGNSVDFEITFAALLATAVISYPISGTAWLGEIAAFAVLTITLVRRIAIASPYAPVESIMEKTIVPIEFTTTACVLILFFSLSEYISSIYYISEVLVFSVISPMILIITVVAQEFVFRDYLIWWYAKFDQKQRRGDTFSGLWEDIKFIAYWGSRARKHRKSWSRITNNIDTKLPDLSDFDLDAKEFTLRAVVVLVGATLIVVPSILLGVISGSKLAPLAIPGIVFAHDHSCYQYVAYGSNSYEEFRKPIWRLSIWAIIYMTLFLVMVDQIPTIESIYSVFPIQSL